MIRRNSVWPKALTKEHGGYAARTDLAGRRTNGVSLKITGVKMILMTSTYRTSERLRSYAFAVVETEDGRTGVGEPLGGAFLGGEKR